MLAITQRSFGGPEVLDVVETDRPQPKATEILVRVRAIGVNPIDGIIRSGGFPLLGEPPFAVGWDFSGVVEEVVPGTEKFQPGDEVYGMPMFPRPSGGYAEFVAAPSRMFAHKPSTIDHVHAAALPLVGLTAWQALVENLDVSAGQRVLILGAGGGLGHVAVQVAKSRGAYVIGTASAGKHDFVTGLGADEVIDYRAGDLADAVRDVDVAFDLVGGKGPEALRVLRPGGAFTTAVERTNAELRATVTAAGFRFSSVAVEPDRAGLESIAALVDGGRLRPHVSHVLPLREVAKAHQLLDDGHLTGKIVLTTE